MRRELGEQEEASESDALADFDLLCDLVGKDGLLPTGPYPAGPFGVFDLVDDYHTLLVALLTGGRGVYDAGGSKGRKQLEFFLVVWLGVYCAVKLTDQRVGNTARSILPRKALDRARARI